VPGRNGIDDERFDLTLEAAVREDASRRKSLALEALEHSVRALNYSAQALVIGLGTGASFRHSASFIWRPWTG